MINAEFYKKELLITGANFALSDKTKKLCKCCDTECRECQFNIHKIQTCKETKFKWLLAEHKEYPKLTRFEKEFLKRIFIDYCQITRDPGGELFAYTDGHVTKGKCGWNISNGGEAHYLCTLRDDFSFIKWEDNEPRNIQELLENCEVEE